MNHHRSFDDNSLSDFIQEALHDSEASCIRGVFFIGTSNPIDESVTAYVYPKYEGASEVRVIFDYRIYNRRICSFITATHSSRKSELIALKCEQVIKGICHEATLEDKALVNSLQRRYLIDTFLVEENKS